MKRIRVSTIGSGILLILGALIVLSMARRNNLYYLQGVRGTRSCLDFSRSAIDDFVKQTHRFPNSLAELGAYMEGQRWARPTPGEWISNRRGDFTEHRGLDGTGGIYYNPGTGEIRVNLTKPVGHYRRTYFGPRRDEVPADW
jgi:hypothetical protein